jgi:hypothetical protein
MLRVVVMVVDMHPGVGTRDNLVVEEEDSPAVAADNPELEEDSPAAAVDNLELEEDIPAVAADNLELEEDRLAVAADNPEPEEDIPVAAADNSPAAEGKRVWGVDNNLPAEAHRQQACRTWDNRWLPGLKGSHNWCMMKPAGYRMHCRTADPGRC